MDKILKDRLLRSFEYLRISVTDRCNFRCSYCMPSDIFNKDYKYISQDKILTYEEIITICKLLNQFGLKKIRLTGGEPLLRKNIDKLIARLKTDACIENISMTTNGSLLTEEKTRLLKAAGLDSITLSIDTLDQNMLRRINGTKKNINTDQILDNITRYFDSFKTNTVVIKDVNDNEIIDIVDLMKEFNSEIRFIEYMDVGESHKWDIDKVVPSKTIYDLINKKYKLISKSVENSSTSKKWSIQNSNASLGLISSITEPFCMSCNRARLSVDGKIFTCLFASEGYDIKEIIRSNNFEPSFLNFFEVLWHKREDQYSQIRFTKKSEMPKVEMSYIGG